MNWSLLALTVSALLSSSLAGSGRIKRQDDAAAAEEDVVKGQVCDFGSGSLLQTCSWTVPNGSHAEIRWKTAQGAQEFWLGGPGRDHTLSDTSGKCFVAIVCLFFYLMITLYPLNKYRWVCLL